MITLYQFQFSHFCEKACWALDYKGLAYKKKNLLPGLHRKVTKALAAKSCVPVIVDGETIVQESAAIISYLDERYPERPLTPDDPSQAKEALEWEKYFDEEIGVPLRLWFYHHTLPDRARASRFMLDGAPWYGRAYLAWVFPKLRGMMREGMGIHAESAARSEERVLAAFDRLNCVLAERPFLVGDRFSRADLAASALLSPLCAHGKTDAEISAALPEHVLALRARHTDDRFFGWVRDNRSKYRHPAKADA